MPHHYRQAVFDDCRQIAPYMRTQDVKEITYSHGFSPLDSLMRAYKLSKVANTIVHEDGTLVGMFGLSDSGMFGSPWLLGTDKIIETRKEFIPQAKAWVEDMLKIYPVLINYVHVDNKVSLRWLKSLGFSFVKLEEQYGVGKQPFYQFVRIGQCVIQRPT